MTTPRKEQVASSSATTPAGSSVPEQLSQLHDFLRSKPQTCSNTSEAMQRKYAKQTKQQQDRLQKMDAIKERLGRIVSEQEEGYINRQVEHDEQDDVYSVMHPVLEETNREQLAAINSFAQECSDIRQENHAAILEAIRRR